jgi:hypothetical protein
MPPGDVARHKPASSRQAVQAGATLERSDETRQRALSGEPDERPVSAVMARGEQSATRRPTCGATTCPVRAR